MLSSCVFCNYSDDFDLIGLQMMAVESYAQITMMQLCPRMDFIGNFPVWSEWILFSVS